MDYFKQIAEMQKEFIKNPRQGIIKFLNEEKESIKKLQKLNLSLDDLLIFKYFHKEYAQIIGKLMETRILDFEKLLDHNEFVSILQRFNEGADAVSSYKSEINEMTAIRLSRAYATFIEIVWKKLRRIVSLSGLNPKNEHLNIPILLKKLENIENKYNIKLITIKRYVDGELRNFVNHETSIFIPPNIISFLDARGARSVEVKRLTTEQIYKLLLNAMAMLTAFISVEKSAIASKLEPLLKLSDPELNEYIKTGTLTQEMIKKMY